MSYSIFSLYYALYYNLINCYIHCTNMKNKIFLVALLSIVSISSCKKDPAITDDDGGGIDTVDMVEMTPYTLVKPTFFPEPETIPANNELYEERIALGKKLFFDTRLSNTGENCESCHKQNLGFSLDGTSASDNGLTSLPLINLAWYKNFMWNSRIVGSIEDVMLFEVTKRFKTDLNKINNIDEYRIMFKQYYGIDKITEIDLAKALAQYMRVLVSRNTRDDLSLRGDIQLTTFEKAGQQIFFSEKGDCFHCHAKVFTTDNDLHNTGLDSGTYAKEIDKGFFNVTGDPKDLGKFRTPNLRNVALRTHYMHDGRFTTLEEVVDFYDHGFKRVSNIDAIMLKPGKEDGLNLTEIEKRQLVAYLKTFTDSTMINDPAFKAP